MGITENIKFYFENGYVITDEEQEAHDKMVAKVVREGKSRIRLLTRLMLKRFETLEKR